MVARIATARLTREIGIIAVAYFAYFGVRSLTEGSFDAAFANAKDLVAFEKNLGFFVEPTANALIVGKQVADQPGQLGLPVGPLAHHHHGQHLAVPEKSGALRPLP